MILTFGAHLTLSLTRLFMKVNIYCSKGKDLFFGLERIQVLDGCGHVKKRKENTVQMLLRLVCAVQYQ